jgi:hypothetical protein
MFQASVAIASRGLVLGKVHSRSLTWLLMETITSTSKPTSFERNSGSLPNICTMSLEIDLNTAAGRQLCSEQGSKEVKEKHATSFRSCKKHHYKCKIAASKVQSKRTYTC